MRFPSLPQPAAPLSIALLFGAAAPALAGPVATIAEMEILLDDQIEIEDFEGLSVHGGTTSPAPNPLNSATAPAGWGIIPGVTYGSMTGLALHGGFLDGDDSVVLQGGTFLTVTFDQPQLGVGMRLIDGTGNVPYHDIVTYFHGATELGVQQFDLPPASDAFTGWQDAAIGITSITVTSTGTGFSGLSSIDNVMFGVVVVPSCPGDLNNDGVIDTADLGILLGDFGTTSALSDLNNDGVVDTADLGILLGVFSTPCP
ncbi:MAG: hypothetical protein H6813_07005 [Phycisphaeraceae bacterium]|nr:hypothetical protein [Phycisphaeraceae bacterium]MCB9848684.1 hypothetical protein [Phycisphaeraceae bacterium]